MYLGQSPVDLSTDPIYKDYTPTDWAMRWISSYSGIDGAHHQMWLVDQIARILKGCPVTADLATWSDNPPEYRFRVGTCQAYEDWVLSMRGEYIDGEYEYEYNTGIAP